jgi:hypothetical protein
MRPPVARLAATGAALVLALSSRGDGLLLAAAVAVAAARPSRALGAAAAVVAALKRWGTTTLGAVAGAQAVLGAAGWTGSAWAVASAWLGASALLLATPDPFAGRGGAVVAAAPFGATAALVAAGPGPGGAVVLRAVVAVIATVLALAVRGARERSSVARAFDVAAVVAGALALACGAQA